MSEYERFQFFKAHRGLQQRVVERSGRDQSLISKIANNKARSAEVEAILEDELQKLNEPVEAAK